MSKPYSIKLNIDFDNSELKNIESKINKLSDNTHRIRIDLDSTRIHKQFDHIEKRFKNLTGTKGNIKSAIPIDTGSLDRALNDVAKTIGEIKTSIGSLDSGAGMKSLLSSINQISTALEKAGDQFEELNRSMSALSGKDLNLNFGINMGGSNPIARQAAYGNKARNETLPQLREQAAALENYFKEYYKVADGINAAQKLVQGTGAATGKSNIYDLIPKMLDGTGSLSSQMTAYKEYIALMKEAARIKGIDIGGVTSQFSKTADDLVQDAVDIQTGAKEMDDAFDRLKQIFGGGNNFNVEGISAQLDSVVADLKEIRTALQSLSSGASLDGLTQSFNRLSETLEKLMTNAKLVQDVLGNNVAATGLSNQKKEAQETAKAFKETTAEAKKLDNVSIDISSGNIDELKAALRSMKVDDSDIEEAVKELNEMNVAAKNVSATFKNGQLASVDIKGVETTVDGLKRAVTVTRTFGEQGATSSKKYSQALDEIAIAADRVNKKLKSGLEGNTKFDVEISDVEKKFSNLSNQSTELRAKIDLLRDKFTDIQTAAAAGDMKELVAANERYEEVLRDVNNQLKINRQEEQKAAANQKLADDRVLFQEKIDAWLTKNSKATKEYGAELLALKAKAESCDRVELDHLEREFKQIDKAAEAAGVKAKSLGDRLRTQFSKYSTYFSAASVFMYVEQGLRSMFEQVVAIDSAMTELKKVTDETNDTYNNFLTDASQRATEIGTTIDGLITSTADFARLGYEFKEAANLAEVANIYTVVGDEIDSVDTATQSVISTMKAFKVEASDSMSIVDKFNEVSNNFAISSGGIGEALTRSASSMAAANNTLDETIALTTAANTVVNLCHAA